MSNLLILYGFGAFIALILFVYLEQYIPDYTIYEELVIAVTFIVLWPLFALAGVGYFFYALGRGVHQLYKRINP